MELTRTNRWPLGINNVAKPDRLPDGAVRDLVNLDPSARGDLSLRAGYAKVLDCTAARAAYAVGSRVVLVDGTDVLAFDTEHQSSEVIGQVADAPVAGALHAGELYLSTPVDSVRTDGHTLVPWAVRAPGFTLEVVPGSGTLGGRYQVAAVATGSAGEESGTTSALVEVPPGSAIRVLSDDPRTLRLYASVVDGATLFYQKLLYGGGTLLSSVRDDTEYLTTDGLVEMPPCEELVSHHAVLVGRQGDTVFFTVPMHPHLMDPVAGFFRFPARVRLLAAVDGGVYIVADKTYFIAGLETREPARRTVLNVGAVEGTAVRLPDGGATWFTEYGQAMASPDGVVELVNRDRLAPDIANVGAAGLLRHNGNELAVTTMRGTAGVNNLATGDFADLEVGDGQ